MDKFEILKSNTIQFTIEMNKMRLSEAVLEDIIKTEIEVEKIEILNVDIDNKERLKNLKQFLDNNKKILKNGLYDFCLEEYREIKDDLKFRNSKDGKLIIEIENWVQHNRESLPQMNPSKIFIGRSFIDPKKLIIGGLLNGQKEMEIIEFFREKNPPVEPEYKFEKE